MGFSDVTLYDESDDSGATFWRFGSTYCQYKINYPYFLHIYEMAPRLLKNNRFFVLWHS